MYGICEPASTTPHATSLGDVGIVFSRVVVVGTRGNTGVNSEVRVCAFSCLRSTLEKMIEIAAGLCCFEPSRISLNLRRSKTPLGPWSPQLFFIPCGNQRKKLLVLSQRQFLGDGVLGRRRSPALRGDEETGGGEGLQGKAGDLPPLWGLLPPLMGDEDIGLNIMGAEFPLLTNIKGWRPAVSNDIRDLGFPFGDAFAWLKVCPPPLSPLEVELTLRGEAAAAPSIDHKDFGADVSNDINDLGFCFGDVFPCCVISAPWLS